MLGWGTFAQKLVGHVADDNQDEWEDKSERRVHGNGSLSLSN